MDSHLLKVFVTVAKEQNVSQAANKLNCAQSNVTSRIKQLEKNLGFKLFNRVSKGVKLTYEGEKLLPDALEIVHKIEKTVLKMQNIDKSEILKLGSTQVNAPIRLIPIISSIKKDFENTKLQIYTNTSLLVIDSILNYDIDVAFVCGKPQNKKLKILKEFEEQLCIVEAKDTTINNCIFTYIKSCIYYEHLCELQKQEGNDDFETVEIQNYETILACVELGMGKAILPFNLIKKYGYEKKLNITNIKDNSKFSTYLITREDFDSPICEYLVNNNI